jgi:twitching motility protein PilT
VSTTSCLAVDFGYGVPGLARFRRNVYLQRGTMAAAFRMIPINVKAVEELELPDTLLEFFDLPMGLVLVSGPTGSGKSTTLAALRRYLSDRRPVHIITIEDPIEFLFADAKASISQREVSIDTPNFSEALRNAVRQDPDVIMVGEMRDPETVATVITAAETGHLVFSTLHTNSAPQTIDRILDNFPAVQQKQILMQLSQLLKGVVSIQLVERADGTGRIAALEIMKVSPQIEQIIEKGKTNEIHDAIESSVSHQRMQTMNQSLMALLVHGVITYEEALHRSSDPDDLSLKLRKMFPSITSEEGTMSPSTADFSEIAQLREFRGLFEEQEDKVKLQLQQKDELIADLRERMTEDQEGGRAIESTVGRGCWPVAATRRRARSCAEGQSGEDREAHGSDQRAQSVPGSSRRIAWRLSRGQRTPSVALLGYSFLQSSGPEAVGACRKSG